MSIFRNWEVWKRKKTSLFRNWEVWKRKKASLVAAQFSCRLLRTNVWKPRKNGREQLFLHVCLQKQMRLAFA